MTTEEMHWAIKEGVQTMDAFTYDNYLPQQIDMLLNEKILTFVRKEYMSKANMTGKGMEFNKESLHNIQTLVARSVSAGYHDLGGGGSIYRYPSGSTLCEYYYIDLDYFYPDFLFLINVEPNVYLPSENWSNVELHHGRVVEHEMLRYLLDNPFRTTSHLSPICTLRDNKIYIYAKEKFIVYTVEVTYIKKPNTLDVINFGSVSSDLPEHTHSLIVDMVIQSILEKIESPRYQQNVGENMLNK